MIYLIGKAPKSNLYREAHSDQFVDWITRQPAYQLDIETNVTDHWCTKKLITLQFGDLEGKNQWVIQWSELSDLGKLGMKRILERKGPVKVIHNAAYEIIVLLFHDIRIRNVYDTMLGEMILHCGEVSQDDDDLEMNETDFAGGFYSLSGTYYRYFSKFLDKTEQMNFGDDVLTESKVIYAASDVKHLGVIRKWQMMELVNQDLDWVAALEMEAVLGYGEMTYHGMELNTEKWLANLELAIPVQAEARKKLDAELIDPNGPFVKKAIELGYYDPNDRVTINWNSPPQKKKIVERFFPFLNGDITKARLEFLLRQVFISDEIKEWIRAFVDKEWKKIEEAMITTDRQWLIDSEFLTPGGAVTINWGSHHQTLPIFQCHQPKLKSTSAKGAGGMGNFFHPIGAAFREWKDSLKLSTTYGQAFVDDHVEPDGRVRTTFNQILTTGRVSSRKPNMQQIPVREPIGPRYRNAFVCAPGWQYVSADYIQQELVIIATLSGEKVWIEALRKRQDLHLVVSELVFKKEFEKAADKDCAYHKKDLWSETLQMWHSEIKNSLDPAINQKDWKEQPRRAKCKCKGHKVQREPCKNLNFGKRVLSLDHVNG